MLAKSLKINNKQLDKSDKINWMWNLLSASAKTSRMDSIGTNVAQVEQRPAGY